MSEEDTAMRDLLKLYDQNRDFGHDERNAHNNAAAEYARTRQMRLDKARTLLRKAQRSRKQSVLMGNPL